MKTDKLAVLAAGAAAAALGVSLCALWLATASLERLKTQSRVELTLALQRQFDADHKEDRAEIARAFLYASDTKRKKKGLAGSPYSYVMEFFDTLGRLVETGAVDEVLAEKHFAYYLEGYFDATQALMRQEQTRDPKRYAHVFLLANRWHHDHARPDLNAFFQDELDWADPPPVEGPRT